MKNIKLYSNRVILMVIVVLMLVISTVSYTFSTLADADEQVTQDITDFSRGAYDILIRPPNAQTDLEKQLNLIEENYLGVGDGGITMEEWEEIKNHPQVDIAAPVASIGLFTARERTWMFNRDEEDAAYYEVEYRTSDGVNTFVYTEDTYIYDFGNKVRDFLWYPSSDYVMNKYMRDTIASFEFPLTFHQVVAVDPKEEGKLTDYDLTPLLSHVRSDKAYEGGAFSIPIMSLKDASLPITIELTIDELEDVTEEDLALWDSKFMKGNSSLTMDQDPDLYYMVLEEYISKKRMNEEEVYELVPEDGHSPFKQNMLLVNEDMKLTLLEDEWLLNIGEVLSFHSHRIGYRLSPVVYEVKDNQNLYVKQTGVDELYEAPTYRDIEEIEFYEVDYGEPEAPIYEINDEDFFGFIENGSFSIVENADSLASAPLGIYGREAPYLASDPSITLHPSAIPGSFITTPAHGLISIDHAEKAKGDAPIDAIRVKVAGITGYDEAAAMLIRELADEWKAKGFTVDIVAGASLQELTVDVEGIGEVVQSFTTLGAADTVLSSWNALQVALTVLYGLVALTFVGFTFFNLLADRQKDEELLAQLGWSEKLIRRMRNKEWLIMLGIPIVLVLSGFTLFGVLEEQWLPLIYSVGISGIFVILFGIANLSRNTKEKQPKKQGKTVTFQNIWFYRFSLLASCIQLFLITILTCFLPFFLQDRIGKTTQTRLGAYVHGEIEGLFIIIVVLLYALSLITVYQSLSRMWKKRAPEIRLFLHLGWGAKAIRRYFLKEVLLWAGVSTMVGCLISQMITLLVIEVALLTVIVSIAGFVAILTITLVGSVYSLHRAQVTGGETHAN